jgi:uncharacterized protein (TIGR03083 family)
MDGVVNDPATPSIRQRARLASLLSGLNDAQWAAPSRCQGWSVKDVAAHLVTVNEFWALSINAGVSGSPTRYLEHFDPVATPAQLVEAERAKSPAEILSRFLAANDALTIALEALDDQSWSLRAEAPPGHLAIGLIVLHGLWDSWIHERDIALPLGVPHAQEADEIIGSLAYVAGLGAAFRVMSGSHPDGTVEIWAGQPDVRFVVEVGSTVVVREGSGPTTEAMISAGAVDLLEALSARAPFPAEIAPNDRRLVDGLTRVFAGNF